MILGYRIRATDHELGKVDDFYFDDQEWGIRYLVVDTGKWLPGRLVLISPLSLGEPDWAEQVLPVSLTKKRIEEGPSIGRDRPVSRQHEAALSEYYKWAAYWGPAGGVGAIPVKRVKKEKPSGDPHLRSVKEVLGYHIDAIGGEVGHVEDFIAETQVWAIRYMVVDTRNWLPGRKVLLSPGWIDKVDWADEQVHVDLTREAVKDSPEFNPNAPVNREYEARLYDYYGRPKYWE
jgi:hypothetical protein